MKALISTSNRFLAGVALAGCLALPAVADNVYDEVVVTTSSDGLPAASVPYGDLDLNSAEGRSRLDARIDYAARAVCRHIDGRGAGSRALNLREAQAYRDCFEVARNSAMSQLSSSAMAVASR